MGSPAAVARRLGGRIRRLRKTRRLSWAHLSARTGLAASDLARIEKGELSLSLDMLSELLRALGEFGVSSQLLRGGGASGSER